MHTRTGQPWGTLYLVATPLGNLEDLTIRAQAVLRAVKLVACEDTRRARVLLGRYDITSVLELYHDHNEHRKTPRLLAWLQAGNDLALITDAGSPAVSDPGYVLVREVLQAGGRVVPIPGPSAVIAAVTASGLPCDRFVFEGYLPRTAAKRRRRLTALRDDDRTIVFFISPHRCRQDLQEILEHLGDRPACLARELTKVHEEFRRAPLGDLVAHAEQHPVRGEITLVVAGTGTKSKALRRVQ